MIAGKRVLKIVLCAGLLFLLTACHSDFIALDYRIYPGSFSDSLESEVAFLLQSSAFLSARGISRIPDGGRAKFVKKDIDLYIYNTESGALRKIASFNDLVSEKFNIDNSLKTGITLNDSSVYLKITPITDWSVYLSWCTNEADTSYINTLKDKYDKAYRLDKLTGTLIPVGQDKFGAALAGKSPNSLTYLNKLLDSIPLVELGLNILEIYPKTEKEYIAETIYLENTSPLARRAVVEQIISKLEKKEIQTLLEKMDKYKDSLEGYKKSLHEVHSKETYELIKSLL